MSAMVNHRATQAEKAAAWDLLMKSLKSDAEAVMDAWEFLHDTVLEREAKVREATAVARERMGVAR